MVQKNSPSVITPVFVLFLGASFLFSIRYFDDIRLYEQNLMLAIPLLGCLYILLTFYHFIIRERLSLSEMGLRPKISSFILSIFLGIIIGAFFFLTYLGAHPTRSLPAWDAFIQFNIYFLVIAVSRLLCTPVGPVS